MFLAVTLEVSTAVLTELRHGGAGETRCTSTGVTHTRWFELYIYSIFVYSIYIYTIYILYIYYIYIYTIYTCVYVYIYMQIYIYIYVLYQVFVLTIHLSERNTSRATFYHVSHGPVARYKVRPPFTIATAHLVSPTFHDNSTNYS